MGTPWWAGWFGLGRWPAPVCAVLADEVPVVGREGLFGWSTMRRVRGPGRWHRGRSDGFVGALAITQRRVIGTAFGRVVVNVPRDAERIAALRVGLAGPRTVRIAFDAGAFREGWHGEMALHYRTRDAAGFVAALVAAGGTPA